MIIARYVVDDNPVYGVIDGLPGRITGDTKIVKIVADPFFSGIQTTGVSHALADVRLVAPVIPRSKVIGVGSNYEEHIAEMKGRGPGMRTDGPDDGPPIFIKPNTAVIGPNEPVTLPAFSTEVSYEAELAVVIGRICKDVPLERVDEVIFGYTCANDLTARDKQCKDGQWTRAKGWDGSCPLGPWVVTDFKPDDARIRGELFNSPLDSKGTLKQDAMTAQMIFSARELISYVSHVFTLLPGDVVLTGTPAGVGAIRDGQRYDVTVDGIGTLSNTVRRADEKAPANGKKAP